MMTLHFIQDIPTPHNNSMLRELRANPNVDLQLWYARLTDGKYSFGEELGYEIDVPHVYGTLFPSLELVGRLLFNRRSSILMVGWSNPTTRILVVLFLLTGRPFNMWFDHPRLSSSGLIKDHIRDFYLWMLRQSRGRIFAVGRNAVEYFRRNGFGEDRVVNMPIAIDVGADVSAYRSHRADIRRAYSVEDSSLFIATGSRLIKEKGFDLLIEALALLEIDIRRDVKVLIVGKGPELNTLLQQVANLGLQEVVVFRDWMSASEFMLHLGAADLAVHPARFDAYGGITLSAMAAGLPVIGSVWAGSAVDRIRHGENGWLCNCEDVHVLAGLIRGAFRDREMLTRMGASARRTAEEAQPERLARLFRDEMC